MSPVPLDLDAPRGVGELLKTTLVLFGLHAGLFLSVTLLVVAPAVIAVDGVSTPCSRWRASSSSSFRG